MFLVNAWVAVLLIMKRPSGAPGVFGLRIIPRQCHRPAHSHGTARLAARLLIPAIFTALLSGCQSQDILDDLLPSAEDKRAITSTDGIGPKVGQIAPDFTLNDTLYTPHTLSSELSDARAVVLYFNMWCPICDTHVDHLRRSIIPRFPDIKFFLIDYVSGSESLSRSNQLANGYTDFTILVAPENSGLTRMYQATMGSTIVIDSPAQVVLMNEDFLDGSRLIEILEALP